jgi:hypothetical protein
MARWSEGRRTSQSGAHTRYERSTPAVCAGYSGGGADVSPARRGGLVATGGVASAGAATSERRPEWSRSARRRVSCRLSARRRRRPSSQPATGRTAADDAATISSQAMTPFLPRRAAAGSTTPVGPPGRGVFLVLAPSIIGRAGAERHRRRCRSCSSSLAPGVWGRRGLREGGVGGALNCAEPRTGCERGAAPCRRDTATRGRSGGGPTVGTRRAAAGGGGQRRVPL